MANRNLEAKIFKMRRRNRKAVFSGGVTKILDGKVSLSKQVINTGHDHANSIHNLYGRPSAVSLSFEHVPSRLNRFDVSQERIQAIKRMREIEDENNRTIVAVIIKNHMQTCSLYKTGPSAFHIVHEVT